MSIIGMSTNSETLLFLAWATRTDLRERLIKVHEERREDAAAPEHVLRGAIKYSQPPVFEFDSVYGPVYDALFTYHLDRVEFHLVDWALRRSAAVYLKDADAATENTEGDYSTPDTGVLWQCIAENDRLLFRLKSMGRDWNGDVRRVANALRLHFTYSIPLLARSIESSFLFQEFVQMSLERVNWVELAALVLEIPHLSQVPLQKEEREGDDLARQFALMKELIWRGYVDFGEFGQDPMFSSETREVCVDLADYCHQASGELRKLERSGSVYR